MAGHGIASLFLNGRASLVLSGAASRAKLRDEGAYSSHLDGGELSESLQWGLQKYEWKGSIAVTLEMSLSEQKW